MLFVCGEREMLLRKSFCIQETGVMEERAGLFLQLCVCSGCEGTKILIKRLIILDKVPPIWYDKNVRKRNRHSVLCRK